MSPNTFTIDNSALLYLALMRKRHTNVYRFSMTLKHDIDPDILQQAVDRVYRRFPTIITGYRPGFFRYTMIPALQPPQVLPDPGCLIPMTPAEIRTCAYRVYYSGSVIAFETFHASTDGYGAVAALTTLVAEYLRLRHAAQIPVSNTLRSLADAPQSNELVDSYLALGQNKPLHLPSRYSYQLPGKYSEPQVHLHTGSYSTERLLTAARAHGVSLTAFLSGIMASSVMEVQQHHRRKLQPVRIMIPADLRRMFGSKTLRNFILYALPTMEPGDEKLPLGELLRKFQTQLKEQLEPRSIAARIAYNVRSQNSLFFRIAPLSLKRFILRTVYKYFGESNSSITLTNIGNVQLPAEMSPFVEDMHCILTPRAGSPYNCAVIALDGKLNITLSSFCTDTELDRIFFGKLEAALAV